MRDVEMPVCAVRDVNVAVWPVSIGDLVDPHAGRKYVDDNSIIQSDDTCTHLFPSDKSSVRRIHGEEITFHPDEITFVSFYGANKMTPRVTLEELPMNDVNVFSDVNDHDGMYRSFSELDNQ